MKHNHDSNQKNYSDNSKKHNNSSLKQHNSPTVSDNFIKYPRTAHLESSRLQTGDSDHDQMRYQNLSGKWIVVEEKLDGGNCAISFSPQCEMRLQSRGHYLTGGGRERQFNLFKQWAVAHELWLLERLEDRYILFGEWLHKKHSIFYDHLPHYFCEFDIWDRQTKTFLSTYERLKRLQDGPVLSVPILYAGVAPEKLEHLLALVGQSLGKTPECQHHFEKIVAREGFDLDRSLLQCDPSLLMEGLYLKVENKEATIDRLKWVRYDFVQTIMDSKQHHALQDFIPNKLRENVNLFAPQIKEFWQKEDTFEKLLKEVLCPF